MVLGAGIIPAVAFPGDMATRYYFAEGLIIAVTALFTALHWKVLVAQFKEPGFTKPAAYWALLTVPVLMGLNYLYHLPIRWMQEEQGLEFLEDLTDKMELATQSHVWWIVVIAIIPAITEEIAFRGLVQHWLQRALKPWRALVVASALFASLHFSIYSFPYLFLVGMVLSWAKMKTNSLYPSMLIHFMHNLLVLELFMYGG